MIFKPELAKLILRGLKSETRRPVKPRERDCRYRPQHTYAVQRTPTDQDRRDGFRGRAKTIEDVRIIVTAVDQAELQTIDRAAGIREGFANEIQFAHYWMRLYDRGWPAKEEALCPTCVGTTEVLGEPCPNPDCNDVGVVMVDQAVDPDEVWTRFLDRHGRTRVWVIGFELEQDPLRLLTPTTRPHGSELGYTTEPWNAMSDEPEAVDLERIHIDWRTRASLHHRAVLGHENSTRLAGLRTDDERLAELQQLARESGVDVTDDLRVVDRAKHKAAERIERKLDQVADRKAA